MTAGKYLRINTGKQTLGTASGALLGSDAVDRKQQRVTLVVENALPDGMDTHITTRLSFKPTCFTAASLTQHPRHGQNTHWLGFPEPVRHGRLPPAGG